MSGEVVDDGAIPPGNYELTYLDYRTQVAWGIPRVVVRFKVLDPGYMGKTLERWYRVMSLKGRPNKYGNFKVGTRSDLYREYMGLFGESRPDRISFSGLKGRVVIAKVRTVEIDQHQKQLGKELQYSTIDELVRIE